jgi:hypothetical protein
MRSEDVFGLIVCVEMREEPDGSEVCSPLVFEARVAKLDSGNGEVVISVIVPRSG